MNNFALGLGLKRRLRATRKWAINSNWPCFIFLFTLFIFLTTLLQLGVDSKIVHSL